VSDLVLEVAVHV